VVCSTGFGTLPMAQIVHHIVSVYWLRQTTIDFKGTECITRT
jgi:hypothetical protein